MLLLWYDAHQSSIPMATHSGTALHSRVNHIDVIIIYYYWPLWVMVYSKNIKCTSRIFVYYFDTTITSFRFRTVSGVLKIERITSRTSGIHSESTVSRSCLKYLIFVVVVVAYRSQTTQSYKRCVIFLIYLSK